MNPASDTCQRWAHGQHSWRHRSEGGFDRSRYDVAPIAGDTTASAFVLAHHYSGTYPSARLRYGIYEGERLLGVAVLSSPTNNKVLTNVFPDLAPHYESLELGRFVLADEVPANAETWFLARAFELAAREDVAGIVSFADPEPHTVGGRVIFGGHIGTIYKAKGARYCGRATPRTLHVLPDGAVLNARAMQKVRGGERGHEYVERMLVGHGARVPRAGENMTAWLAEALAATARTMRHRGVHRYVFPIGPRRRRVRIAPPTLPYPTKEAALSPPRIDRIVVSEATGTEVGVVRRRPAVDTWEAECDLCGEVVAAAPRDDADFAATAATAARRADVTTDPAHAAKGAGGYVLTGGIGEPFGYRRARGGGYTRAEAEAAAAEMNRRRRQLETGPCAGCNQPLHTDDAGDLVDSAGDSCCEIRYDDCGACQDGEPHPHWTTAHQRT